MNATQLPGKPTTGPQVTPRASWEGGKTKIWHDVMQGSSCVFSQGLQGWELLGPCCHCGQKQCLQSAPGKHYLFLLEPSDTAAEFSAITDSLTRIPGASQSQHSEEASM